ncbi:hypothetical protein BO94DRAFT_578853 [Aspergillus sclerotioniger CBS 115572]|uniref:Uncharacterized protein n=1 Tax=Aspergillus sclerotioniger CBS 115572 TaxID=1450535 RepID=A0A317VDX2_9EURO|nr:hypothetical protein BO94DRAFT_578853 [Aspergillus sclerotioniger CBS 115572]PWY71112.1 hypothetical protein BO94DRAFT_578853 [Aspergillus sclerotioniger CBS 115572]
MPRELSISPDIFPGDELGWAGLPSNYLRGARRRLIFLNFLLHGHLSYYRHPDHIKVLSNLPDVREEILKDNAKRIIIRAKTESLYSEDCRATAYRIVSEIFPGWEQDSRILFLAIEVWHNRIFINIDVNRDNYNYDTAHKDKTILPVYVLRRHRGNWVLLRWPKEDGPVAAQLAEVYRVTGYGAKTPFFENHNSRIVHANPREFLK